MQNSRSILFLSLVIVSIQVICQSETVTFENNNVSYQYEEFNTVETPKGLLVLFDGGSGIASRIPKETDIAKEAGIRGIKTIGIDQSELYLSDSNFVRIKTIIEHVMADYAIASNLFIGGFSLGGITTLRFTEMAIERSETKIIPNAIFAIDPPIDHIALRNYCLRELERECPNPDANQLGKAEAQWIMDYYERNFGNYEKDSSKYVEHSSFTSSLKDGGNARFLLNIPINMIHEIDVMWLVQERCRDLSDANVIVGSKLINLLNNSGNKDAILTLTQNKGYRSDGRRHPHSWSIADPKATLDWLWGYSEED